MEGKEVLAGNYKLMDKENITYNQVETIGTVVHVASGVGTMWEAVFGDVGVTLIAVLNSMRAMKTENI